MLGEVVLGEEKDRVAGAEWSGRDRRNYLIYTRGGRVFRRRDGREVELANFNGLKPEPQPAPDWARKALSRRGAR